MHDQPINRVEVRGPDELIAGVPYLLGFHPIDSIVAIALIGELHDHVHSTRRADIPPANEYVALAHKLAITMRNLGASGTVLVIVGRGEQELPNPLPYQDLVTSLDQEMLAHGINVRHIAWAAGTSHNSPWQCYDDPACCGGQVPAPEQTPLATALIRAGRVAFASKAELEDTLGPDNQAALVRRAYRIVELTVEAQRRGDSNAATTRQQLAVVRASMVLADRSQLDDEQIAKLAVALGYAPVRDICLGDALTERAETAERLWTLLIRSTPVPHRAHPAALLAASAYVRGDCVMADIALRKAEDADPEHIIARALRLVVDHGLHPGAVGSAIANLVALTEAELGAGNTD